MSLKSRSNQKQIHQLVHTCQVKLRCKFGDCRSLTCRDDTQTNILYDDLKLYTVGQGDTLLCHQGSLVDLVLLDYKSQCGSATICANLVNIQIDRQHFYQIISMVEIKMHHCLSVLFLSRQNANSTRVPWCIKYCHVAACFSQLSSP